ncbi:hypothetical protein C1X35_12685 [Pseudomonas sp. FW306-1C-G01A]|nr:hypothetical protein C1X56_06325 [Pseudomonas sp. GW101-1A09]PMV92559.1 hypothetical protein C1X51_18015 [Pseudomonas sp. FW306-2-2C-B10A]PMV96234.1 hypothetical protein C1X55_19805 [Pseudomonas sp. GW460-C8]PMW04489.1 hypothetical protein C1X50_17495 [Pseudomonas sp. MPR-TSA4]PMW15248.1 hypothetical protein C1X52_13915 [Pseudomonas sp. FW306-2-1A-C05A]PMW15810.1 hypothetical protein C1X40_20255 [Pseudomonas sp. GW456-11-11-14-TSB2]PMW19218.1 hypothetical protein C1X53_20085 [Pseudomonas s
MGASLLAKAVCRLTIMLPDTAPSRAGSLPQGQVSTYITGVHLLRPATKELAISTLRAIVARAAAPKNLHQTGKISRV